MCSGYVILLMGKGWGDNIFSNIVGEGRIREVSLLYDMSQIYQF